MESCFHLCYVQYLPIINYEQVSMQYDVESCGDNLSTLLDLEEDPFRDFWGTTMLIYTAAMQVYTTNFNEQMFCFPYNSINMCFQLFY